MHKTIFKLKNFFALSVFTLTISAYAQNEIPENEIIIHQNSNHCSKIYVDELWQNAIKAKSTINKKYFFQKLWGEKEEAAVSAFHQLTLECKHSPQAAEARLAIAEIYKDNKRYADARLEYLNFVFDYETHPKRELATYMLGELHFAESVMHEKDQTPSLLAISRFSSYLNFYPNSPRKEEIQNKLVDLYTRVAKSEDYIANYNMRNKAYKPAYCRYALSYHLLPKNTKWRAELKAKMANALLNIPSANEALIKANCFSGSTISLPETDDTPIKIIEDQIAFLIKSGSLKQDEW